MRLVAVSLLADPTMPSSSQPSASLDEFVGMGRALKLGLPFRSRAYYGNSDPPSTVFKFPGVRLLSYGLAGHFEQ
jgi:hypothetical protein